MKNSLLHSSLTIGLATAMFVEHQRNQIIELQPEPDPELVVFGADLFISETDFPCSPHPQEKESKLGNSQGLQEEAVISGTMQNSPEAVLYDCSLGWDYWKTI